MSASSRQAHRRPSPPLNPISIPDSRWPRARASRCRVRARLLEPRPHHRQPASDVLLKLARLLVVELAHIAGRVLEQRRELADPASVLKKRLTPSTTVGLSGHTSHCNGRFSSSGNATLMSGYRWRANETALVPRLRPHGHPELHRAGRRHPHACGPNCIFSGSFRFSAWIARSCGLSRHTATRRWDSFATLEGLSLPDFATTSWAVCA